MIPTRWMAFDALPKNANGKIDRQRLREEARYWAVGQAAAATALDPVVQEGSVANSGADEGT